MDFPGICEHCPLALICATSNAYEEKNLCHCHDCKRVMMVFREIGRESIKKMITKAGRQPRTRGMRAIFKLFYSEQAGDVLIGLPGNFSCPHPYTGPDYVCPTCRREREKKSLEKISYDVRK